MDQWFICRNTPFHIPSQTTADTSAEGTKKSAYCQLHSSSGLPAIASHKLSLPSAGLLGRGHIKPLVFLLQLVLLPIHITFAPRSTLLHWDPISRHSSNNPVSVTRTANMHFSALTMSLFTALAVASPAAKKAPVQSQPVGFTCPSGLEPLCCDGGSLSSGQAEFGCEKCE